MKGSRVLVWAVLVGLLTGFVGGIFRIALLKIVLGRDFLMALIKDYPTLNWLVPTLVSAVMVQLAFSLMRRFAPETGGSGIQHIEGALDNLLPLRWQRVLPVKFLGGLLAIGSGMLQGREGPTIQMGASIGKMCGSCFQFSQERQKTLIAAGAGAGLAAAFNAPLAGILFVIEEMRPQFEYTVTSYQAVILASAAATFMLRLLMGQEPAIKITVFTAPPLASLWIFALLGIFLGIIGYFFNLLLVYCLDLFSILRGLAKALTPFSIGATIGFLAWLYNPLTGQGDEAIFWAFDTEQPSVVLGLVFLVRFGLTLLCYGSGAPGGIFAPMLALATIFSLGLAREAHAWFPFEIPAPAVLAVAGMGAIIAATVGAPLTAIVLTMEMSANYWLILPLLVTCLASTIAAHALGAKPIYSVLLKRTLGRVPAFKKE